MNDVSAARDRSREFKRLRVIYRAEQAAVDARCWLCGQPIDWDAEDGTTDDSFTVDHFFPVSTEFGRKVQLDVSGWRPAHSQCNKSRGDRAPAPAIGPTSRRWL